MGRRRRRNRCAAGVRHVWAFRVVRFVFFNRSSGSSFVFFLPLFVIYARLIVLSCKILPSFLTVPGTFRKGALRFKIHVRTVCTHACSLLTSSQTQRKKTVHALRNVQFGKKEKKRKERKKKPGHPTGVALPNHSAVK